MCSFRMERRIPHWVTIPGTFKISSYCYATEEFMKSEHVVINRYVLYMNIDAERTIIYLSVRLNIVRLNIGVEKTYS